MDVTVCRGGITDLCPGRQKPWRGRAATVVISRGEAGELPPHWI